MRGVTLTYERIREWCLKFGQTLLTAYESDLLDRAIDGAYTRDSLRPVVGSLIWRAVDQDADILDILPDSEKQEGRQEVLSQPIKGLAQHFLSAE